jgi:hypothetical protein
MNKNNKKSNNLKNHNLFILYQEYLTPIELGKEKLNYIEKFLIIYDSLLFNNLIHIFLLFIVS